MDSVSEMNKWMRIIILTSIACAAVTILGFKAFRSGMFETRRPLELNGEPALLFFNVSDGCECQMVVSNNANHQIASWSEETRQGVPVFTIDIDRRPDLADEYGIYRVPALVLVDSQGQMMWMQDYTVDDDHPLDLHQFEDEIQSIITLD